MIKIKYSIKEMINDLIADNLARRKFMNKSITVKGQISGIISLNFIATAIFRISHYLFCKKMIFISKLFYALNVILFGCDISPMSDIGAGFVILHLNGIAIHGKIGKNALFYGANAIGGRGGDSASGYIGGPIIGDNFIAYRNANVLAAVEIGDNVTVGAMSLVLKAIPSNKVVVGIPVHVIKDTTVK